MSAFVWALLILLFSGVSALAVPSNTVSFEMSQTVFVRSHTEFFSYGKEKNQLSTVGMGFQLEKQQGKIKSVLDGDGFFSLHEAESYINPKEAYIGTKWGTTSLFFGRYKHQWSQMDEYWNLGIWQPQFL